MARKISRSSWPSGIDAWADDADIVSLLAKLLVAASRRKCSNRCFAAASNYARAAALFASLIGPQDDGLPRSNPVCLTWQHCEFLEAICTCEQADGSLTLAREQEYQWLDGALIGPVGLDIERIAPRLRRWFLRQNRRL